jgi:hypothetical protein
MEGVGTEIQSRKSHTTIVSERKCDAISTLATTYQQPGNSQEGVAIPNAGFAWTRCTSGHVFDRLSSGHGAQRPFPLNEE